MGKSSGTGPPWPGWWIDGHVTVTRATDQSQQHTGAPLLQLCSSRVDSSRLPPQHCFLSPGGGVEPAWVDGWSQNCTISQNVTAMVALASGLPRR